MLRRDQTQTLDEGIHEPAEPFKEKFTNDLWLDQARRSDEARAPTRRRADAPTRRRAGGRRRTRRGVFAGPSADWAP